MVDIRFALVLLAAHGLDALPDAAQRLLGGVAAQTAGLVVEIECREVMSVPAAELSVLFE